MQRSWDRNRLKSFGNRKKPSSSEGKAVKVDSCHSEGRTRVAWPTSAHGPALPRGGHGCRSFSEGDVGGAGRRCRVLEMESELQVQGRPRPVALNLTRIGAASCSKYSADRPEITINNVTCLNT